MGKAKVVKKPKSVPKVLSSLSQRTSKNSVKTTTGRTTMNSSATAFMSIPPRTLAKKSAKKEETTGSKTKPKIGAAVKKVAVKTGARKMRSAGVTKVKPKAEKVVKASASSKVTKVSSQKEVSGKKIADTKKQKVPSDNTAGKSVKHTAQARADLEKSGVKTNGASSAKSKTTKKEKESAKPGDVENESSTKPLKVASRNSRSTDSNSRSVSASRTPSRRESVSSTAASRSRKNSMNSAIETKGSQVSKSKDKGQRKERGEEKEVSPAPKSRRSTVSTEKQKSKSPSPKPSRKRSQSGSSTKDEDHRGKQKERIRNKSESISEVISAPESPGSSTSVKLSPVPRQIPSKSPMNKQSAKAKGVLTSKTTKDAESSSKRKSVDKGGSKSLKLKPKVDDGAKSVSKSTNSTAISKGSSANEGVKKGVTSVSKAKTSHNVKKAKNVGARQGKRQEPAKSKAGAPGKSQKGVGKRMSTVLASAASRSKALAIKSLSDDRAVARKLASKAIKSKTKPKPKPKLKMRPKSKKRMASLNAKAILEASFSTEQLDKKPKAGSPPKQSPGKCVIGSAPTTAEEARLSIEQITSTSELAARYENLLSDLKIEIRSGPPPQSSVYTRTLSPANSSSSESSKPKSSKKKKSRKSTDIDEKKHVTKKESLLMTTSEAGTSTTAFHASQSVVARERKSLSPSRRSVGQETESPAAKNRAPKSSKPTSESSRTPVPPKKAKKEVAVETAETSTSTPSWGWEPYMPGYAHPSVAGYAVESTMIHHEPGVRHSQQIFTAHSSHAASAIEDRVQGDYGDPRRFDGMAATSNGQHHVKISKPSPQVLRYDAGTVYQPAGPLIEPHKTGASTGLSLPETVRLPPDLKVTYQTNPPVNSSTSKKVSSASQSRSHKSASAKSDTQKHGGDKGNKSSGQSASKTPNSVVLHQPYKTSSSTQNGATISSRTIKISHQQSHAPSAAVTATSTQATFSVYGTGEASPNLMPSPANAATISHQHTLSSTNVSLTAHHPGFSASTPTQGMYYHPNFLGAPAHHSPFAPNKYPIVPPDTFRSPYPSSFLCGPTAPQTSPNFYMTPFYTPPMTPTSVPVLGQPRGMLPSHSAAAAATAYYQSTLGPPSAAATSSQHGGSFGLHSVGGPSSASNSQLQPSLHSIPSQSSPGHAGPFHPNPSSPPACPYRLDSSPLPNITISTTSSKSSNITNTKPPPRLQQRPQQQQQPQCATPAMRQGSEISVHLHSRHSTSNSTRLNDSPQSVASKPTAIAAGPPKTLSVRNTNIHIAEARQQETKTYSEQYSLPDDITITPILVVPENAASTSKTSVVGTETRTKAGNFAVGSRNETKLQCSQKPKDIVHVIDPRSGQTTTIAKHISSTSNLSMLISNQKKNISPVKPNNAGNVGKINPDLDVIVIPPGQTRDQISEILANQVRNKRTIEASPRNVSVFNQHFSIRPAFSDVNKNSSAAVNLVQPLPPPSGYPRNPGAITSKRFADSPMKPGMKRKGILECIDGLQKKKMKLLQDETNSTFQFGSTKSNNVQPKSPPSAARAMACDQIFRMRNSTIVNEREAVVAASALVVPPNGAHVRLSPLKNGLRRGKSWTVSGLSSSVPHKTKSGNLNIITRSSIANARIKTRSSKERSGYIKGLGNRPVSATTSPEQRTRHRLLRRRISAKDSLGWAHRRLPQSQRYNFVQRWKKAQEESSTASAGSSESSSSSSGSGPSRVLGRGGYASTTVYRGPGYSSSLPVASSTAARTMGLDTSSRHRQQPQTQARIPNVPGSMAFNALKKRAIVKPLSPNVMNGALHSMMLARRQPKWSNGWRFEGEPFQARVYLRNDDPPVIRRCYPAMRHEGGDIIQARDCVLLKSGPRKTDLPFVAKVAALWENPTDGEMMFSLLWYYRPEHTELGRTREDMPDEIFASKHRDCNSVATIEDRCYVLTLNEYCRYKKRLKQLEEGIPANQPLVPLSDSPQSSFSNFAANIALAVWQGKQQGEERRVPAAGKVSPEVVFFCRKVYDFRQKRLLKNPS